MFLKLHEALGSSLLNPLFFVSKKILNSYQMENICKIEITNLPDYLQPY